MTLPPAQQFTGNGPLLEDMSRPSPDGAGGGGLGAGKVGGGKHGGSGGTAAAAVAGVAVGVSTVAGSAVPSPAVSLSIGLPGQSPELTALFECPVCFDYVLPPILQCQAGHLVCNLCRQKLSCCPTCRGPLTPSIRNLAMEKVASTLPFPCKYSSAGCGLSLHHTEKPDHEEVCEFRPYTCPCPGATCKWHGSLEAVMPHLMHAHKSITTLQPGAFGPRSIAIRAERLIAFAIISRYVKMRFPKSQRLRFGHMTRDFKSVCTTQRKHQLSTLTLRRTWS
uniref:RING-type E3 ubiquitin transferase n=1 Tax=Sander lucioperca TaxID=283035 RepID=A0A8D0CSR9_SANLU